jgi:hypothetical protein
MHSVCVVVELHVTHCKLHQNSECCTTMLSPTTMQIIYVAVEINYVPTISHSFHVTYKRCIESTKYSSPHDLL